MNLENRVHVSACAQIAEAVRELTDINRRRTHPTDKLTPTLLIRFLRLGGHQNRGRKFLTAQPAVAFVPIVRLTPKQNQSQRLTKFKQRDMNPVIITGLAFPAGAVESNKAFRQKRGASRALNSKHWQFYFPSFLGTLLILYSDVTGLRKPAKKK